MMTRNCIMYLVVSCWFVMGANGQDLHYSLFDMSPLNLNPANVGQFEGNYRFVGNHRHQWKAVTLPYSTYSAAIDANDIFNCSNVHAGLQINQDRAGDSRFNTFMVNTSVGYSKSINADSSLIISAALLPGITNRSIDYSALHFDAQYNGWSYNPALDNTENFQRESRTYFNLGSGFLAQYELDDKKSFQLGIGLFNLTQPKQSFFNEDAIKLDTRWVVHGSADISISEKLAVIPGFLLMGQGTYRETLFGSKVRYLLQDMRGVYRALYGGAFYRNKDAGYLMLGMDYDNWKFGLSYDINLSSLRPASNGRGALELALIYVLKIYDPEIIKRRICRDFM